MAVNVNDFLSGLKTRGAPRRRSEAVYHAVKRAILLRNLAPGAPLLEADLAADMNCSQGTVREALMRLQQDGLVARRGYRGTVVCSTSAEEAALLAELRLSIEPRAAAAAAVSEDEQGFETLQAIVASMREDGVRDDSYRLSELDQDFHRTILRMADFESVEAILTRCMLHIYRHTLGAPERRDSPQIEGAADEHEALLAGIRSGDPDTAATAARTHIETVVRRWSPDVWDMLSQR